MTLYEAALTRGLTCFRPIDASSKKEADRLAEAMKNEYDLNEYQPDSGACISYVEETGQSTVKRCIMTLERFFERYLLEGNTELPAFFPKGKEEWRIEFSRVDPARCEIFRGHAIMPIHSFVAESEKEDGLERNVTEVLSIVAPGQEARQIIGEAFE
jgi:hypothetical protein